MRIISHAYPPPPPPPLTMDDLNKDLKDMQPHHDSPRVPRSLDVDNQSNPPPASNHTHDPVQNSASSAYPNSPATIPHHHERPPSDPATVRTLLSTPHHPVTTDWRVVAATDHRRNGEHASPSTVARDGQASSSKRKLDDPAEESQNKIRRTVRERVGTDYARVMCMTTVVCLHAAVAQKSYGSEKRFLCPPPVVRIESPHTQLKTQHLAMCIVTENGERGPDQRSPLDNNMVASFKYLHVAGTAKSKSFQLALDIGEQSVSPSEHSDGMPSRVWASFDSAPVTIISKPSKKTAKTRNISSCILAGGPVSLFNRINSQTVRTKYMTIEHAQLCASNLSWSAFNVTVTRRHADTGGAAGPQPVTYGSEIQLVDSLTGITTNPLIIRKVDKGKVSAEDGGPVSQMQKIALQRINADGSRSYLSASGPVPGAPLPGAPTPGSAGQPASHPLLFQAPRVRDEVRDGMRVITDEVDDYLCWTIVGISKFQYTFFDASGHNSPVPNIPITPFPTLFTAPAYRPAPHTIELTVSNFFYQHPESNSHTPLEVWLGGLGPLRQRIFQATPPGPLTSVSPYAVPSGGPISGEAVSLVEAGTSNSHHSGDTPQTIVAPPRFVPSGPLHTIIIVDLPPMSEIVKSLRDSVMSLTAGAAEAARMIAPGSRSPPLEQVHDGRRSEDTRNGSSSDHRSDAGPSSGQHASVNADPRSSSHSALTGMEDVQAPEHGGAGAGGGGSLSGQSLPLLFIRGSDGMGYHSGRSIACDHTFHPEMGSMRSPVDGNGRSPAEGSWLPSPVQGSEGAMQGWSLRVI